MRWRCQIYFQPSILNLNSPQPFSMSEIRDDRSVVTPYEGFRFISCSSEFGLQHNTQMLDHNIGQLLISLRRFSFFFSFVFLQAFRPFYLKPHKLSCCLLEEQGRWTPCRSPSSSPKHDVHYITSLKKRLDLARYMRG